MVFQKIEIRRIRLLQASGEKLAIIITRQRDPRSCLLPKRRVPDV